jgi:hypothetical protein
MKRTQTFRNTDTLQGWAKGDRDERLWKYLRPVDDKVASCKLADRFDVMGVVVVPPAYLVDRDAVETNEIDRGDFYEAFYRNDTVTIRGVFANGEPLWGDAEYSNGMSYSGRFGNFVAHGFGEKRAGGNVYKGTFNEGLRHGKGLLLDSKNGRIYMGSFVKDKPNGQHLCIVFSWSDNTKRVLQSRSIVTFHHGKVVVIDKSPNTMNVTTLSGLSNEEFLKFYRKGEKAMEDAIARRLLAEHGADTCLWTPVDAEVSPF